MPTDTFFNLSKEKRKRVLEAAIAQFAHKGYSKASVTQIVINAKIAKGSFYQYFNDKKDLYIYVVKCAINKKLEYLESIDYSESDDFLDYLIKLNIKNIKFAENNINLARIINNLPNIKNSDVYDFLENDYKKIGLKLFIPKLREAAKNGKVNSEINVYYTAHLLYNSSKFIMNYFLQEDEMNTTEEILPVIESIVKLISSGIKGKGG
ncbi:MAG: TetR/AcrR family transcriptional regulator [Halanaerobiales bacterium]